MHTFIINSARTRLMMNSKKNKNRIKIDAETSSFIFYTFFFLAKPRAYIAHNATLSLTAVLEIVVVTLIAANVAKLTTTRTIQTYFAGCRTDTGR